MIPISFVFIVTTARFGVGRCALLNVESSDRDTALDRAQNRIGPGMVLVASMPIYDKISIAWDYFTMFLHSPKGEYIGGLRFSCVDIDSIIHGMECYADAEWYAHEYAVVVSSSSDGQEFSTVYDCYAEDIDSVRKLVEASFSAAVSAKVCAVFSSSDEFLVASVMQGYAKRESRIIGGRRFISMTSPKLALEFERKKIFYDNGDLGECWISSECQNAWDAELEEF